MAGHPNFPYGDGTSIGDLPFSVLLALSRIGSGNSDDTLGDIVHVWEEVFGTTPDLTRSTNELMGELALALNALAVRSDGPDPRTGEPVWPPESTSTEPNTEPTSGSKERPRRIADLLPPRNSSRSAPQPAPTEPGPSGNSNTRHPSASATAASSPTRRPAGPSGPISPGSRRIATFAAAIWTGGFSAGAFLSDETTLSFAAGCLSVAAAVYLLSKTPRP